MPLTVATRQANAPPPARLFRTVLLLKGLNGLIEVFGGVVLWLLGPGRIIDGVYRITQDKISEDPREIVATHLRHAASHISLSGDHFMAAYLFINGVVKVVVVLALLRSKLWAYPLAMSVFGCLVAYQLYRFTFSHGIGLILLSAFDLLLIWLVWGEYRAAKEPRPAERPA
jgi:uncharacterized membrane protein